MNTITFLLIAFIIVATGFSIARYALKVINGKDLVKLIKNNINSLAKGASYAINR